jgi:hypothetical protein
MIFKERKIRLAGRGKNGQPPVITGSDCDQHGLIYDEKKSSYEKKMS